MSSDQKRKQKQLFIYRVLMNINYRIVRKSIAKIFFEFLKRVFVLKTVDVQARRRGAQILK